MMERERIEDKLIERARENAEDMLERLLEIANTVPASHVSVKAAEAVIKLAREKTQAERDPFNMRWPQPWLP